jgi:hypothetical protein
VDDREYASSGATIIGRGKIPGSAPAITGSFSGAYGSAPTGEAPSPFALAPLPRRRDPSKGKPTTSPRRPELRTAFRAHWKAAVDAAVRMSEAAETRDPISLGIASDDLESSLKELWKLRAVRDIDWQTILNHAQGMLRQAFAERRVERLTPPQCRMIRHIVEDHLGPASKTADELNEVLRLIEDAGFDPFCAISGDPSE